MGKDKIHFFARIDGAIDRIASTNLGKPKGYAIVHLKDNSKEKVTMKMGLSYVNVANAKLNLEEEVGAKSFDEVFCEGKKIWSDFLNQIEVGRESEKEKEIFYSPLYQTFLWPA